MTIVFSSRLSSKYQYIIPAYSCIAVGDQNIVSPLDHNDQQARVLIQLLYLFISPLVIFPNANLMKRQILPVLKSRSRTNNHIPAV